MGVILATPAATKHNVLSAFHSDAAIDAVTRGSLICGNSTPAWDELTIGGADTFLKSDGTDASWQTPAVADISDIATTYLKLDASNDPVTAGLEINAATAGEPVLILQSTDDNQTSAILELQNSAGASLLHVHGNSDLILLQQVFS